MPRRYVLTPHPPSISSPSASSSLIVRPGRVKVIFKASPLIHFKAPTCNFSNYCVTWQRNALRGKWYLPSSSVFQIGSYSCDWQNVYPSHSEITQNNFHPSTPSLSKWTLFSCATWEPMCRIWSIDTSVETVHFCWSVWMKVSVKWSVNPIRIYLLSLNKDIEIRFSSPPRFADNM